MSADSSLYGVLGVGTTFTTEEIKRHYRQLVRQHHPDAGGDPERFRIIQQAYEILSDPEKRRRYDETGSTENGPDNSLAELAQCVIGIFDAALNRAGMRADNIDLVAVMRTILKEQIAQGTSAQTQVQNMRRGVHKVQSRLKFKGDGQPNILEGMLKERLRNLDLQEASNAEKLALLHKAVEHVELYGYEIPTAPPPAEDVRHGFLRDMGWLEPGEVPT